MTKKEITEKSKIDRIIGAKLRTKRIELGFSLAAVASAVDISEFELARLESGTKRISAITMVTFCKLFHVLPFYFFEHWEISDDSKVG